MDRFVDVGHSLTNIAGHHFESGQKIGAYADKPHMGVWGEKGTSIEMRARLMPSLQRFGGKTCPHSPQQERFISLLCHSINSSDTLGEVSIRVR